MKKFLDLRLRRFVPVGLIALAAAVLLAPAPARATPYVVKLVQQGSNVVASGSGSIDLAGLTLSDGNASEGAEGTICASSALFFLGHGFDQSSYTGLTGPTSFGSGGGCDGTPNGSGGFVGTFFNGTTLQFFVFTGYISGTALSDTATWDNASFASLGVTPGTYEWTWGAGAYQSFTLIISNAISAPEPAGFGVFGLGLLLIGGFVGLRRRAA